MNAESALARPANSTMAVTATLESEYGVIDKEGFVETDSQPTSCPSRDSGFPDNDDNNALPVSAYLHPAISRQRAERLLAARRPVNDGRFLIRIKATNNVSYSLRALENGRTMILAKYSRGGSNGSLRGAPAASNTPLTSLLPTPKRHASFSAAVTQLYQTARSSSQLSLLAEEPEDEDAGDAPAPIKGPRGSVCSLMSVALETTTPVTTRRVSHMGGLGRAVCSQPPRLGMVSENGSDEQATGFEVLALDDLEAPQQFVLSLVHKARMSHHLLARARPGDNFKLNDLPLPCYSLEQVVQHLSSPQPKWPVVLTEPVAAPEDTENLQHEAKILLGQGYHRSALHCLSKIINALQGELEISEEQDHSTAEKEHQLAQTFNMRSFAHYGLMDYSAAAQDAYQAVQLEPAWWRPHYSRGMALKKINDLDGAARSYKQALAVLPRNHPREAQCQRALDEVGKRRDETLQLQSRQSQLAIRQHRAGEQNSNFHPDLSDLAAWYLMRRRQSVGNDGCPADLHREIAERLEAAGFLDDELATLGVGENTIVQLDQLRWEAPLQEEVGQEQRQLEQLHRERLAPRERWRGSQKQQLKSWQEWYYLRLQRPLPDTPTRAVEATTRIFSWALTVAHMINSFLNLEAFQSRRLTVHVATTHPLAGIAVLELAALLPEVGALDLWQVVESRDAACVLLDDTLPGAADLPVQHLRHIQMPGMYEASAHLLPRPDVLLVMQEDGSGLDRVLTAGMEDVVDDLHRKNIPLLFTQTSGEAHQQVRQWVQNMLLTPLTRYTGANPFASLTALNDDTSSDTLSLTSFESTGTSLSAASTGSRQVGPANGYQILIPGLQR